MNSAAPTTAPLRFSMSPNALMAPRPQSVLTARKSARLTPSLSTYCSRPSASISEGGLMRKIHGLPLLIGACDCAGPGVAVIAARTRATRTIHRVAIGRLLRDGEGWQGEYPRPPVEPRAR